MLGHSLIDRPFGLTASGTRESSEKFTQEPTNANIKESISLLRERLNNDANFSNALCNCRQFLLHFIYRTIGPPATF